MRNQNSDQDNDHDYSPNELSRLSIDNPRLYREVVSSNLEEGDTIDGEYGKEGFIIQEKFNLPSFNGNYPILGSWVIGQQPCGIGIRESKNLITGNTSRFIPHLFDK